MAEGNTPLVGTPGGCCARGRPAPLATPSLRLSAWRPVGRAPTLPMSSRTAFHAILDPTPSLALTLGSIRSPTILMHRDLKAITVFLASTATPRPGGLPYLDAVLP